MTTTLRERARELLHQNTRTVSFDGRRYTYTVPSPKAYPFQWLWDSCFIAIVFSILGEGERAAEEIRSLLSAQEPDGFIPHVIFWDPASYRRAPWWWHYWETKGAWTFLPFVPKPHTSAFSQPPVLAQAVERIYEVSHDDAFVREVLPNIERFHRWYATVRDPDHDGLLSIVTQFESGLDHLPVYDVATGANPRQHPFLFALRERFHECEAKLRFGYDPHRILEKSRFVQEDVFVSSIFGLDLRALARLADVSRETSLASWARAQADRVTAGLLERSYDAERGYFWNLIGREERRAKVRTVAGLIPLILPDLPHPIVEQLVNHLTSEEEFWTPFPVPTVAVSEPSFTEDNRLHGVPFIWRGPLSMNINWFFVRALRRHGYEEIAEAIAERSRLAVERHGFYDFYNPRSGVPVSTPHFAWATLVVDMEEHRFT